MLSVMTDNISLRASQQDGTYPRPQLLRTNWLDLNGTWEFQYDDKNVGLEQGWAKSAKKFEHEIVVPFPPESKMSGIEDTTFHRVLWYRRGISVEELQQLIGLGCPAFVLHFGAVDYVADVWINGNHVASHSGGHTPFEVTISAADVQDGLIVTVRAEDDPHDLEQPRGKQDWQLEPHVIWYNRTSGIWQTVWLESVPDAHITNIKWTPEPREGRVKLAYELSKVPPQGATIEVTISYGESYLASNIVSVSRARGEAILDVPALKNGQDESYLWSPNNPVLIDAQITLQVKNESPDSIASYFGFRTVGADGGDFLLNDRPHYITGVLSQGFWPESNLTAPSADALRAEVELIKKLGFTTARVHQKVEDPRLHFWADKLGLMIWVEMPSAYEFSNTTAARLMKEWQAVVERDMSHPSVVAWVPINESWGVQHIAHTKSQQDLARALYHFTKALDPTRLVISNDGWEHIQSDLYTIHDYENDVPTVASRYATEASTRASLDGLAPNGRRMLVGTVAEAQYTQNAPMILSEFGGVSVANKADGAWGYQELGTNDELGQHLSELVKAIRTGSGLSGIVYTQLTDTGQETNGLTDAYRNPKLPTEFLYEVFSGKINAR